MNTAPRRANPDPPPVDVRAHLLDRAEHSLRQWPNDGPFRNPAVYRIEALLSGRAVEVSAWELGLDACEFFGVRGSTRCRVEADGTVVPIGRREQQ